MLHEACQGQRAMPLARRRGLPQGLALPACCTVQRAGVVTLALVLLPRGVIVDPTARR